MQPRDTNPARPASTADLAGRDRLQGGAAAPRRDDPHRSEEEAGQRRNAADAFDRPSNADGGASTATPPRRDFPQAGDRLERTPGETGASPEVLERTEEGTVHARPNHDGGSPPASMGKSGSEGPLLGEKESGDFRNRWEETQRSFVDEPRDSVKRADELVAEVMQKLASQFAETRSGLERQWDRGSDVSTEDLRVALQRYRDFFNRLLAA